MFDEEAVAKLRALHRQLRELEEKHKEIIGQIERLGPGTGAKALKQAVPIPLSLVSRPRLRLAAGSLRFRLQEP